MGLWVGGVDAAAGHPSRSLFAVGSEAGTTEITVNGIRMRISELFLWHRRSIGIRGAIMSNMHPEEWLRQRLTEARQQHEQRVRRIERRFWWKVVAVILIALAWALWPLLRMVWK